VAKRRKRVSRRQRRKQRLEEEKRLKAKRTRNLRLIAVAIVLMLIVSVGYIVVETAPPPDYVQCFPGGAKQHTHFNLFIQIGPRRGPIGVDFIRLPDNLGVGPNGACMWPMHIHDEDPATRGQFYTKIHLEAPNTRTYTLGDLFVGWGEWAKYPKQVYFASDGVSYYRTTDFAMRIHTGEIDPFNDTYENTRRVYSYDKYAPQDGDYIELVVNEPFDIVPGPYEGGEFPLDVDFTFSFDETNPRRVLALASASNGVEPYTFSWDFDDGTPRKTGETISHTYSQPGRYWITLYVVDSKGTAAKVTHVVDVS
jgi:hypothetical protein